MIKQIEKGNTVTLKSGGPLMTVLDIFQINTEGHFLALCAWFDGEVLRQNNFPPSALDLKDLTQ